MGHARELHTDPAKTAFFFVALPEAQPIAVIKRFANWFHDFGIPVGGVIVNMVIQRAKILADAPDVVKNRVAMQDGYMQQIWSDFDGNFRAIVPLLDNVVLGAEALRKVEQYAFG
jgi:arsenite-transporting ATPase